MRVYKLIDDKLTVTREGKVQGTAFIEANAGIMLTISEDTSVEYIEVFNA